MKRSSGVALAGLLLLAAALAYVPGIRAHGIGTPRLLNEPAGPYLLSAWTDPDPLRADQTHVVVAVSDPASREPIVSGVEIIVTMTSMDDPALIRRTGAGTDNVNQLLYAAEFNDQLTAGRWRVGLNVSGERGAGPELSFEVTVEPARGLNWLWIGVSGLAAVLVLWVVVSAQPSRARGAARAV